MHAGGLRPTIGIIQEHVDEFFWANRPRHKPPIESPQLSLPDLVWHSWLTFLVMRDCFYRFVGRDTPLPPVFQC